MEEQTYKFTIFLIDTDVTEFRRCIKADKQAIYVDIKEDAGIDGVVVYGKTTSKEPSWLGFLQSFCDEEIKMQNNTSNKAVLLLRVKGRIMAMAFGHGRSFLKDECIVRNFGLLVALNIIDEKKIRSINSATIEDMIVNTQKQSSYATAQDEFSLNHINDILTAIAGKTIDETIALNVSGKDSLLVSVKLYNGEITERLEAYLDAYESIRYKETFAWIDNIQEIRGSELVKKLNNQLVDKIRRRDFDHLYLSPPEMIAWDNLKGFMLTGMGQRKNQADNYKDEMDIKQYANHLDDEVNILDKIKRDRIYIMDMNEDEKVLCSIYAAIVTQVEYEGELYILYDCKWYKVESSFYENVKRAIKDIPISNVELPVCGKNEKEGDYNSRACNNEDYCLLDKVMFGVEGGVRKIEACDIFTKDKKFIHVKKRDSSAQLSHLFSQGKVSAECFVSDLEYRRQISKEVQKIMGEKYFDCKKRPGPDEYEVVFAIIAKEEQLDIEKLPFFSLVNLMMSVQEFQKMHMKYSVKMVKREE